jgi:type IV pilus assembly protein PilB
MEQALKIQRINNKRRMLGECLIEAGCIDREVLDKALRAQKIHKKKLGQILIEMGAASDDEIAQALANQMNIPLIHLSEIEIPKEIIALVPVELVENYLLIPVREEGRKLLVAAVNPLEFYAMDDLRFVTQMSIEIAVASQGEILSAIEKYYPKPELKKELDLGTGLEDEIEFIQQEEQEEDNPNLQDLRDLSSLPPIVRFVNKIFGDAIRCRASDIHIEPQKTSVLLRYRIDGVMREIMKTDRHVHAPLVSRIKVISNMDISVRRRPQDGRSQVKFGKRTYDLRVSSIPTSYGEKITIRILDQAGAARRLEDLALSEKDFETFEKALAKPEGIMLVTGPTGSGKTSTLYACLNRLNSPQVNIFTVEDPVEFDIPGVNQVQVHPQAGITFAVGLRSILRQDPDIVMVGEIRDSETASIAFQAGQTGHLVLSTLHTNDAPSSVTRLLDLGVQPFIVSDSLIAVIGQRLVRKICPRCKSPDELSGKLLKQIAPSVATEQETTFWKGKGCEACQYTGYTGRLAIIEILSVTPTLKEMISSTISAATLQRIAEGQGYEPMVIDGLRKAAQGLTTVEEVFRVTSPEFLENGHSVSDAMYSTELIGDDAIVEKDSIRLIGSVQPKKILLAEENEVTLKLVGNYLEAENYVITKARTGLEALKLTFQQKPDLIITDLMMPELDGIGLIKKLKSQLVTRYIPIIVLTIKSDLDSEVTAINAGADDYITKPVNAKRLLARVGRLIQRQTNN